MKKINFILLVFFSLFFSLSASTDVSGPTFTDTIWNEEGSPYNLTGDFQVPSGVTLTIKENVVVNFDSDYEILIKGAVSILGTVNTPVIFNGNSSGSAMLMFKSTNLSNSSISYVEFYGPKNAIQLAEETESNQDDVKNSGSLSIYNISVTNSKIQTNGYTSTASLQITDSNFTTSTIRGDYPRSEDITLTNCNIDDCTIESDSYNYGISIKEGFLTNSSLLIGCCSANITLEDISVENCTISEGDGQPINGPINIKNCSANELEINLPDAEVNIEYSEITNSSSTIKIGNGYLKYSKIIGNESNTGVTYTGYDGYNISGDCSIVYSEITNFNIGVKVTNCYSFTVSKSNIYSNTNYNFYNSSSKDISADSNYWGFNDISSARSKIYDYYKNINYGEVIMSTVSESSYSTEDVTTDSESLQYSDEINVYPNPVIDFLTIEHSLVNEINYRIISTSGKVLSSGLVDDNNLINFNKLSPGIYIIHLVNNGLVYSTKVIKK